MIRNIKALGLAIVAVGAMSMAVAASVQAAELHATTQGSAVLTGQQTQQHVFQTQAGTVTCGTANFEGTVASQGTQVTAQEATITPTYSGCEAFGLNATVQMNGCKYTITGKANTNTGATTALTSYVDVSGCTSGKQIVVNAAGGLCTATIPEQHNLSHLVYKDEGTPGTSTEDVGVDVTVSGITYELHGLFCPGGGATGLRHDGTYHGKATFKAFVDSPGQQQVTEHGHQFNKPNEGAQVGLRAT